MRRSRGIVLGLVLMGAAPAAAQEMPDGQIPLDRYRACPVAGMSPGDYSVWTDNAFWTPPPPVPDTVLAEPGVWSPPPSALPLHRALRGRLGAPMPTDDLQIRVFRGNGHNVWNERSLIATRSSEGRWTVDEVVERNPGTAVSSDTYARWSLARSGGLVLDEILADPCLKAEPARSSYPGTSIGGYIDNWTLEIARGAETLAFERQYGGFGRVAGIVHLLNRDRP